MIVIPVGPFLMGSDDGQDNEKPIHEVWLDEFRLAKFPVTNAQYRLYVEHTGVPEPPFWHEHRFSAPEQPVVGVNWFEATCYCQWLAQQSGAPFRLPTEAEREKAARGGLTEQKFPWGQPAPEALSLVGYDQIANGPLPVGGNDVNPFDLYDMAGGVHEWCSDFYHAGYYANSPRHNPTGPTNGARRASRGGSWRHGVKFSRCAARSSLNPDFHYADYGFRIALNGGGDWLGTKKASDP